MTTRTDREEEFHPAAEKNQPKTCLFFRARENCFSFSIGQTTNLMCEFVTMSANISTMACIEHFKVWQFATATESNYKTVVDFFERT
jgi:hypothetical protein